ncbi:glycosyltransferase family 4 protein [Prosthecochloris sp. GSB1]|uniref:glycosyltransferase family 4 protein n=1 Tax=Prosthecochloris sp. GSB1 TaxID=281093 RepID=UPI00142E47B6|nr:glycosyltransferase [Prosthecochloris sp. GSB1]
MKMLVVEPKATGHHMVAYTRFIVREAVARGWSVDLLTTKGTVKHEAFGFVRSELPDDAGIFHMDTVDKPGTAVALALMRSQNACYDAVARGFRALLGKTVPDFVYVVNLDHFDKILALRGSPFGDVPFGGMMMSVKFHRYTMRLGPKSRNDAFYGWLFRRMLAISGLKFCAVIDEPFFDFARAENRPVYRKLSFVPDVGELHGELTRNEARRSLGIADGRFVVLVFGSLMKRKGIRELFEAVRRIPETFDILIHMAGRQNENIRALMKTPLAEGLLLDGRLMVSSGFQDERQEYIAFRSADAAWVGYVQGFSGSSGVLIQAASIGVPVIASSNGLVGWMTGKYGLGTVVDPSDAASAARAIERLADDPAMRDRFGFNGIRFARSHTSRDFGAGVCNAIAASAGEGIA